MNTLYITTGAYMDDKGTMHPVSSAELYIPWNNTWVPLPTLPDMTDDDGSVYHMTNTHIMTMTVAGDGNRLYLVGSESMDLSTLTVHITKTVWELMFNRTSHGHYWDSSTTQAMGE